MNTELYNAIAAIDPEAAERYKANCETLPTATNDAQLPSSFPWSDTPEGHLYWSGLCDRLPREFGWSDS